MPTTQKALKMGLPKYRHDRLDQSMKRLDELFKRAKPNDPEVQKRRANAADRREALLKATGGKPKVSLICMTPRSGSTFFSAALRKTKTLGNPGEWFNAHDGKTIDTNIERYGCTSREELLDYTYTFSATDNGVAVIKGDYFQCLPFIYDGLLEERYGRVKYVFLTREDLLAQAISRYIGTVTQKWSTSQQTGGTDVEAEYDREGIEHQLNFLLDMEEGWRHFFATRGIYPARFTYEQLTKNLDGKVNQMAKIMNTTVPEQPDVKELPIQKQGSTRNKDWAERFISETKMQLPSDELAPAK